MSGFGIQAYRSYGRDEDALFTSFTYSVRIFCGVCFRTGNLLLLGLMLVISARRMRLSTTGDDCEFLSVILSFVRLLIEL